VSIHVLPSEKPEDRIDEPDLLLCRFCRKHITDPSKAMWVDGAHAHTFANPHGHVYEIGCFQAAVGVTGIGLSSEEFSWFEGYVWQVAVCDGCTAHLGWRFSSPVGKSFYGLILDHLIQAR
jgi:hypothetical protein